MRAFAEMSLDARLAYGFHVCMFLFFVGGGQWLSDTTSPSRAIQMQIGGALLLAGMCIAISMVNRHAFGWRWPGASAQDAGQAALSGALLAAFLFAATPMFPPTTPGVLAWYLAGAAFGLWTILLALKVVAYDQATFEAVCLGETTAQDPWAASLPAWQRWTRRGYAALFILAWLLLLYWFYSLGLALHDGAKTPDVTHTHMMSGNGLTVYLTTAEMQRLDGVKWAALMGLPAVGAIGAFLHHVVGVPILTGQNSPDFD